MTIPSVAYFFIIIIYLLIGAAIVFHLLYYRINRRASMIMFIIYIAGSVFLLVSNFILFRSIDWYHIFISLRV